MEHIGVTYAKLIHKHCSTFAIIRGCLVEMFQLRKSRLYGMNSVEVPSRTFHINDQTKFGTLLNQTKPAPFPIFYKNYT